MPSFPLVGSALRAYNNLPGFPFTPRLGTLLNELWTAISGAGAQAVSKPADTVRNVAAPGGYTADPDLSLPVDVGFYRISLVVQATIDTDVPGLLLAIAPGGGAVLASFAGFQMASLDGGATTFAVGAASFSINGVGSGGSWALNIEGVVEVTTAGTIDVFWGADAGGADVTLLKGSSMTLQLTT